MKRFLLLAYLFHFIIPGSQGQGLYCAESHPFCTGTTYNFPAATSGYAESGPYYYCLITQPCPAWYHMLIADPGPITIYMYSTPLHDIDFICWGPFSDPFTPCTAGLTADKVVDCCYCNAPEEWCDIPNAQTGEYYILLITNFSQQPCNITFSQIAGSGSTDCTILPPPVSNNGPLCVGDTLHLYADSIANATYLWSGPDGFTSTYRNPVIVNITLTQAGDYSCIITVFGQSSDPAVTSVIVYERPQLYLLSNDTATCPGSVAYLIFSLIGTGTFTVDYNDGANNYSVTGLVGPVDTVFVYPISPITYFITNVTDSLCSQTITDASQFIDVWPYVTGLLSGGGSICIGDSLDLTFNLTGIPPWTITYTQNGFDPQTVMTNSSPFILTVTPLVTTYYEFVTLQDNNCSGDPSGDALVTVYPEIQVNAGDDQSIPYGTYTTLAATASGGSGFYHYNWVPPDSLLDPTILCPTTINLRGTTLFTLIVTDNFGDCHSTDEVLVTVTGGPLLCNPTADPGEICAGESSQLQAMPSGGSGNYTYSWSSSPPGFYSDLQNPVVEPLQSTEYILEVNDGYNLSACSVYVLVYPLPVPEAGDDQVIPHGTSTTLNGSVSGGSGSYQYHWSPEEYLNDPDVQNPITVNLYSTTLFILYVTDDNSGCICEGPDDVTITLSGEALSVSPVADPESICLGETSHLFSLAGGGSGIYSYTWTSNPTGFNSDLPDPTVMPVQTTTYSVLVDDGYNTVNGIVTVSVFPLPVPEAGDDQTISFGTYTDLAGSASGGSGSYQYHWEPADKLIDPNVPNPTTINLYETTLFSLTVTDETTGCICAGPDNVIIVISGEVLTINPSAFPDMVCMGDLVTLHALAGGGTGSYIYSWSSQPPGFTSNLDSPVIYPEVTTTYTVLVSDGFSQASGSVTVTVMPAPVVHLGPPDTTVCVYDTITLDAGNPGAIYHWSNGSTARTIRVGTTGIGYDIKNIFVSVINQDGCDAEDSITIYFDFGQCFGIEEAYSNGLFRIYPNPVRRILNIETNFDIKTSNLMIIDVVGQCIMTCKIPGLPAASITQVDLSGIIEGIYFIRLQNQEFMFTQKILVK